MIFMKKKKNWRKEFKNSCHSLKPDYDWPEILCELLSKIKDKTLEADYRNEALNFVMKKGKILCKKT